MSDATLTLQCVETRCFQTQVPFLRILSFVPSTIPESFFSVILVQFVHIHSFYSELPVVQTNTKKSEVRYKISKEMT